MIQLLNMPRTAVTEKPPNDTTDRISADNTILEKPSNSATGEKASIDTVNCPGGTELDSSGAGCVFPVELASTGT